MVCFDSLRYFFRGQMGQLIKQQLLQANAKQNIVQVMESSDFGPILMAPFYPSFLLGGAAAGAIDGDAGTGPTPAPPNLRHQDRRPPGT